MTVIFLIRPFTPYDCEPSGSLLMTMNMGSFGSLPMLVTVVFGFTTYDCVSSGSLLMVMLMLKLCTLVLMIMR